jgi:hypothetical protein
LRGADSQRRLERDADDEQGNQECACEIDHHGRDSYSIPRMKVSLAPGLK